MKNFEQQLNRLEELSSRIKDKELSLEEMVSCFDEGIKLSKKLEKELTKVEKQVEILVNEPEPEKKEAPEMELFDSLED